MAFRRVEVLIACESEVKKIFTYKQRQAIETAYQRAVSGRLRSPYRLSTPFRPPLSSIEFLMEIATGSRIVWRAVFDSYQSAVWCLRMLTIYFRSNSEWITNV